MASFSTKTFTTHDDYMTPISAWNSINQYIPKDKVIWEAFYGDGTSGKNLEKLGNKVIHKNVDFFENDLGDIIVSNPPFSLAKKIMPRLLELDKPFILLMPSSKVTCNYMRDWKNKNLQIIIPRKRIHFIKVVDGEVVPSKGANFDCFFYCYKMNIPKDILWLDDDGKGELNIPKKKKKIKLIKKTEEYTEDYLNGMSLEMLRDIGKDKKLKGFSYVRKDELIRMILENKSWLELINQ